MSMTREEASAILEESKRQNEITRDNPSTFWASHQMAEGVKNAKRRIEAFEIALSALRPVSREQVEKVWRGEWLHPHWHNSESCADCSRCNADVGHREFRGVQTEYNFCPVCGAAQNDKAVEMVMERMEALHGET